MAVANIKIIPDPVLRKKATKIRDITKEIKDIAKDLVDTLDDAKEPEGAGLAAPQLGISKRIVVVREFLPDPANPNNFITQDHILINPKVLDYSKETQEVWEGCLSVPDTYGKVERPEKIKVIAKDLDGNNMKFKASGYLSSVIQHEIDHLDGILFTDKITGETLTEEELTQLGEEMIV